MSSPDEVLKEWYQALKEVPKDAHLLCPQLGPNDDENYKTVLPTSAISDEERKKRIKDADRRIQITYWNSVIFAFDQEDVGTWAAEFADRLTACLRECSNCIYNWHMKRRHYIKEYEERWDTETADNLASVLTRKDISRINQSLSWAKEFIQKIEQSGTKFKRSLFGDHQSIVLTTVYEALCCPDYIAQPETRTLFQYVFSRLQGKNHLRLGATDPIPALSYFVFDFQNDDRRAWAYANWEYVPDSSMTIEQFDWAMNTCLVSTMDYIHRKTLRAASPEDLLQIEQFWTGFERILKAATGNLIMERLRNLERKPGCPTIYDLLYSHISSCNSEGVLVIAIRVITGLIQKCPTAFWGTLADAKPNVVADLIFASPAFPMLLQQSVTGLWTPWDASYAGPFAMSWIGPWMESIPRDRKCDACEVLLQSLLMSLPKVDIGEAGLSACIRAGFDALAQAVSAFDGQDSALANGTTHLYADMTFNLVVKFIGVLKTSLQDIEKKQTEVGWATFKVSEAAMHVACITMDLDTRLWFAQHRAILRQDRLQDTITRKSDEFWMAVRDIFEITQHRVEFAKAVLRTLGCLTSIEQFRKKKTDTKLDLQQLKFNEGLGKTEEVLTTIIGIIADFDVTDLNTLLADKIPIYATIGLSLRGDSDLAEACAGVLKAWTEKLSRSAALEEMALLHTDQILASIIWAQDQLFRGAMPWSMIKPLVVTVKAVLRSLVDPSDGVLRKDTIDSKSVAILISWWKQQWTFVSECCRQIENWSYYIERKIMTDFCREIMELAESLIMEDGLFTSAVARARNKSEGDAMKDILAPAKNHFGGMEMMIRLKDEWLVAVTTRVLCKILTRLRENDLEINSTSRQHIIDACVPIPGTSKYKRATNLRDGQRADFLQALGNIEDEVQFVSSASVASQPEKVKKQTNLKDWSKSGASSSGASSSTSNRDDVLNLSRSIENPVLKRMAAERQAKAAAAKSKTKVPDLKAISALKESRQREKALKAQRDAEAIAKAKQLRGESDGSLGLANKDRSEIMVHSSDEESDNESEDEEAIGQLAAISSGGQKSLDAAERKQMQALRDQTRRPVKKIRQQRSVKEMKARLLPPMDRLHNTVLAWDIFHEGNEPPSGPQASSVATTYSNPRSYQDTFFPLLASEAWRSFVTAKDELTAKPFGMNVASRANVDNFIEITFTLPVDEQRDRGVFEGDILLVSESDDPLANQGDRHCLARVHRTTFKKERVEIIFRVASRGNALVPCLTPGGGVHGIKITNMTTIEREYAALESLQYYDLMDEVLKAEPSPILRYGDEKVNNYMANWALNRGQAMAVLGAQENDGFTLIQGPPGTGKTKTIIAMVGALLSEQLAQSQMNAVPLRPSGPITGPPGAPRGKKLLVCAPSNAAVDELVLRLKNGIVTSSGKTRKINVLRLGRSDAISAAVKDVTLEELVRIRLEGDTTRDKAKADRDKMHETAGKLKEELSHLIPRIEDARLRNDTELLNRLSRERDGLKKQQMEIGRRIDADKESGNTVAREVEMRRRQVQQEILNASQVLCATLSGSGHEMFRNLDVEFETVIIDEAAQCVELSALIPLKYGCCKCILVGDPKQLPPTVLSQSAARFGYDQSLFVRMQQNHPKSVHLLDMQYRMHPEISCFPSKEFYEGQLKDGQDMAGLRNQPWHKSELLGPYRFFDIEGSQERGRRGQSLINTRELDVALQMYDRFSRDFAECDLAGKIGIITPYKAQLYELRSRFRSRYGESITDIIEFNTTDAFQGRECEIIIFSCVRASATGGIGFMTDIRRMNVGLTRAKSSLWILGDARALRQGEFWAKLIEDAKERNRYTKGDVLGMFRRPLQLKSGKETSPPSIIKQEDVEMSDAPSVDEKSNMGTPSDPPSVKPEAIAPRSIVVASRSPAGPPAIRTSTTPAPDTKKRGLDSPDSAQPEIKRIASTKPRSGLMNKFGQKPPRPVRPPTDPAGMTSLGLVPPERPPARLDPLSSITPTMKTKPLQNPAMDPIPQSGSTSAFPKPPRPDPSKLNPNGPTVPKKKGKPSMFIPKKR
ncbi:hypothetical protein VHEMI06975 [[Torrubiella] hemipterigena]|uniref:Helicase SEN1 n=1 Tax=[Torrubiella] hemipterigena TaxID=1531966 RepID=A0A0A1T260_9HYPO|nr:hypothetical protein VHEMI06975 [[Torrubiella] hemipterigena]